MQSTAATVEAYIAEAPPERQGALERLREACIRGLPGCVETMTYGMASYGRPGEDPVICFASQKQYIAFYAGQSAVTTFAEALKGLDNGKGCIRYRKPAQIDFAVVDAILADVHARRQAMS
jgi:uncharacterized protein YdhG (YjbR/CyaY superfamily)